MNSLKNRAFPFLRFTFTSEPQKPAPMTNLVFRFLTLWSFSLIPAHAVNEKGDWPWNLKLNGHHDAEVAEALGTGWFLNVGPTGIRARITHEHPEYLTVKYVFKKSPAAGIVNIGDIIVGANGKKLTVPHTFGRGSRGRGGWAGPMEDMAKLIEDSQGKDGKLELIIWPGGEKSAEKTVTVPIEAVGRFSPTWPFDCPRSEKLAASLRDFLEEEYKREGGFKGGTHVHTSATLALLADGSGKHDRLVAQIMSEYGSRRYDPQNSNGFPAWGFGHDGILMGEWYLLKKDRSLLPAIESLNACLVASQTPESGGYSHKPYPTIQQRIVAGGPKGYGAMALPGGLAMVAMSLFKEAGLEHADPAYQRVHQAFLGSVGTNGSIDYGFKEWDHAVIVLDDAKGSPKNSPKGVGYLCEEGMAGIGGYKIEWPTKADPRYRPTDWLRTETETNHVYDFGGAKRIVVRTMAPKEPTSPFKYDGRPADHYARSGVGALAHSIGNKDNKSWGYLSDLMATACANSPNSLLDGHASTHMHVLWGSLGAAMAEREEFQKYMEGIKWWFIMAQAHDGSYVVMPGRDYASTDHVYGGRVFPSACAAMILSVKDKRLQITGAPRGGGSGEAAAAPQRAARKLAGGKDALLNDYLLQALAALGVSGELKPQAIKLSKASAPVMLEKIGSDGSLVFRAMSSEKRGTFAFAELAPIDRAELSALLARLKPEDGEAQVMAGVYLEIAGKTAEADSHYEKAGEDFAEIIGKLFE